MENYKRLADRGKDVNESTKNPFQPHHFRVDILIIAMARVDRIPCKVHRDVSLYVLKNSSINYSL
jgi:hypothetical protein